MGRPLIDRTGSRVGRLLVIGRTDDRIGASGKRYARWLCRCDCGAEVKVMSGHLNEDNTTSCGCAHRDMMVERNSTHGATGTAEHEIWRGMRERCRNPNAPEFESYGGRGIKVCDRWSDFEAFRSDMGERPSLDHSIDRKDVNGDYEPANCRWATPKEQSLNRRNNVIVELRGERMPLSLAVERIGGDKRAYKRIHKRMKYAGESFGEAIPADLRMKMAAIGANK